MVKNLEKGHRVPSASGVAAGLSDSVGDGTGWSRQRGQDPADRAAAGTAAEHVMIQPKEQSSEEETAGESAGLHELEDLLKQIEVLKNKMRDLFERARETKLND